MTAPMFSIVTPTWGRLDGRLERCVASVSVQTFRDYEHIVVDDGSKDGTWEWLQEETLRNDRLRPLRIEHQGRVVARNEGMRAAQGKFIAWLDSDDAYDMMYLETFAYHIAERPEVDLWVTGAVVHGIAKGGPDERYGGHTVPVWSTFRRPWVPEKGSLFNSGRVGTGMFVFRKRCLDATGYLPPWKNPMQVADGFDEYLGLPPGTTGYGSAGPKGGRPKGWLGNPWGDDHALYQALCLHFQAHILVDKDRRDPPCLYIHYTR